MKLVPITITEEIFQEEEDIIVMSDGQLDLDSGDISVSNYREVELDEDGKVIEEHPYDQSKLPALEEGYAFSTGLLKIGEKELEFAIDVDIASKSYEANANELEQIKSKALNLASGGNQATPKAKKTAKIKK